MTKTVLSTAVALVLAAWVLVFTRTMDRALNHDEHQFLAPAALVGREGLVPWRDFPLYHLPNLVYAYAWADRATGNLVFGAKLVSFAATAAMIAGLVFAALRNWPRYPLVIAASLVLLLLGNPIFRYTAGKTWNHEVPTALLLAGGGCLLLALRRDRLWLTMGAGVLGGLAVGCRLTFAPALVGLFLFALLFPLSWRRRMVHASALTASATLALSPTLYFLALEPEKFAFCTFEFPRLRLTDPDNTRIQKTVSIWRKFRFFFKEVILPNWPVFLLWLVTAVRPGWQWLRTRQAGNPAAGLWLLLFPFVLTGCFAPARYQLQHFFVFIPFVLMAVASGGSMWFQVTERVRLASYFVLAVSLLTGIKAAADFATVSSLFRPREWFPFRLEQQLADLPKLNPARPILTLSPTFPLTARARIYPEFAAGTFGWRSAHLVPAEQRQRLELVAPEDLDPFLAANPPAAILTGVEKDEDEEPLVAWAREHGFRPTALKKKRTLWVPPARF